MKLSEKLRLLREEKGKTQEDVKKELGIGITTLRNYENDKLDRMPNTYQLKQLKDYYGVTYEYLLDEECKNRNNETLEIGNLLKLSDKAIDNIKNLQYYAFSFNKVQEKDVYTPQTFNYFIENFGELRTFLNLLNSLEKNIIFYKNLIQIMHLCDFPMLILHYVENDNTSLNEMFSYYDKIIEENLLIYRNAYNGIEIDGYFLEELEGYYEELKEICNEFDIAEDNINGLNVDVTECLNEILEISIDIEHLIIKEIGYIKYSISNVINEFLDNLENIKVKIGLPPFDDIYLDDEVKKFIKMEKEIRKNKKG